MRKFLLRLGDYVFVMRPLILIPAWSFYLLGAGTGRRLAGEPGFAGFFDSPAPFYYGFACLTAILVCAYLLNQVFDRESDRLNDKGHFLTRGIFRVRTVVMMAVVAFLVASWWYRSVGDAQRPALLVALVLSLVYSLPPLRLVNRPVLDLLANATGYGGVAFVAGFAAWNGALSTAAALSLPYVCLVGGTFLFTTILDVDGDRTSGKITTSVWIGVRHSVTVACALVVAGWFAAFLVSYRSWDQSLPLGILSAGVVVFAAAAARFARGETGRAASNTVQAATVVVTVPALYLWPEYALLLVPILAAARVYYRARFGINYPGPAAGPRPGG